MRKRAKSRQPFWLSRVSEILDTARNSEVPFLDRCAVEKLFDVRKRQAIRLMHKIGGYHVGKAFVLAQLPRSKGFFGQFRKVKLLFSALVPFQA